jgi:hypothetical protein
MKMEVKLLTGLIRQDQGQRVSGIVKFAKPSNSHGGLWGSRLRLKLVVHLDSLNIFTQQAQFLDLDNLFVFILIAQLFHT